MIGKLRKLLESAAPVGTPRVGMTLRREPVEKPPLIETPITKLLGISEGEFLRRYKG